MADLTKDRSLLLDKFVSDCITFRLNERESLEYILNGYGPISRRTYFRRRKKLLSDETRDSWLSYYTRIGFVELQKKLIDDIQSQYDDTMHQLFVEITKNSRNEDLIIKLKKHHIECAHMLSEFSLGIPIFAALKARLDKTGQGIEYHFRELNH